MSGPRVLVDFRPLSSACRKAVRQAFVVKMLENLQTRFFSLVRSLRHERWPDLASLIPTGGQPWHRFEGTAERIHGAADRVRRAARTISRRLQGASARLHVRTAKIRVTTGTILSAAGEICRAAGRIQVKWPGRRFLRASTAVLVGLLALACAIAAELSTSALQSRFLANIASRLTWRVESGPSPRIVYPWQGPFDFARGYSRIPDFEQRLARHGFQVAEQVRFSSALAVTTALGVSPPAREKPLAGLAIRGRDGTLLYDGTARLFRFRDLDEVPPIAVEALLRMEDRKLLRPAPPWWNPAVDWGRMVRAATLSAGNRFGLPLTFQGGSTLAVQMEKYRHSRGGLTRSVGDKLRQVLSASLRVYGDGPNTREKQREIILDYVNTVPLGGAPGYGEVYGLGEGLRAWFGIEPENAFVALGRSGAGPAKARALKHVLALLCAVRAPSRFLSEDRPELERRVAYFERQLHAAGVIDDPLFRRLSKTSIRPAPRRTRPVLALRRHKEVDLVRRELLARLGVRGFHELDRLDLEVATTLDADLQAQATALFKQLQDPAFVAAHGLAGPRLLESGDPHRVVYSFLLMEHTPAGDAVRVHADNLPRPFDLNADMRMELGSTAKLRTLAHYLDVVERIHGELSGLEPEARVARARAAGDPLTRWVAAELDSHSQQPVDSLLAHSLERRYSASPYEAFFTGGGLHAFHNFDAADNRLRLSLREAFARSTNLVFIRLMRDLVRYHEARLPYSAATVLNDPADSVRARLLEEAADEEAVTLLARFYRRLGGAAPTQLPGLVLGDRAWSDRNWAALYWAWHPAAPPDSLVSWAAAHGRRIEADKAARWARVYGNTRWTLRDYGYLLGRHPLELWCGDQVSRQPSMSWRDVLERSTSARKEVQAWLFSPRQHRAQNLRLRARIERDAFDRMTEDWRRLGFPFQRLVPSYATAIGSSADRPEALAELVGVTVNDGVRPSPRIIEQLRFGGGSPYETVLAPEPAKEDRVLSPAVAHALRGALAAVVETGTARRVRGVFRDPAGVEIQVGGKTGSGDNRLEAFARGGRLVSSHAINRTAAFVFYVGDRYYGVVTASVMGGQSAAYHFTSALPLEVFKLLAPAITARTESNPFALTRNQTPRRGSPLLPNS